MSVFSFFLSRQVKHALDMLDRHHDDPLQSARLSRLSLAGLMVLTAEDIREEGMPDWMQVIFSDFLSEPVDRSQCPAFSCSSSGCCCCSCCLWVAVGGDLVLVVAWLLLSMLLVGDLDTLSTPENLRP